MIRAALHYAARLGWPVFPVRAIVDNHCDCRKPGCGAIGKHPRVAGWQHEATTDARTIERWWRQWPSDGIGLHASEFWVLDVDPRHGGDESLRALERQHGGLPVTPRQLTGGGGVHYLFAPSDGIPNCCQFLQGLDARSRGGFIVATPSRHRSGREYAWDVDAHPLEVPLAPAPAWLLKLLRTETGARSATPPDEWVALLRAGVNEGCRDNTITRLAGHLLRRNIDPYVALELLVTWNTTRCRPPLEQHELEQIVTSLMRKEAKRRGIAA